MSQMTVKREHTMRKYGVLLCLLLCLLFLFSCVEHNTVEVVYKEGVDPNASLAFIELDAEQTEALSYAENAAEDAVYFTENGSVWHKDKECASLKRSKSILSGTVEDAAAQGKTAPCKRCSE